MRNRRPNFTQKVKDIYNHIEYDLKPYEDLLGKINKIHLDTKTDEQLKHKSEELKSKIQLGASLENVLVEAYALVREVSKRIIGQFPFDTQVMAAIALHFGKVVEMQTGEGKTLAAVMPAYLNALLGKGVHVLTFNDYLAGRDAEWMGPIYEFLGLTAAFVKEGMSIEERKKAYRADITYVTAKEAGFDYLRDSLCTDKSEIVHRNLSFAIIDEADSILIDEARIPLVIAGEMDKDAEQYSHLCDLVQQMALGTDYEVDENGDNVCLTDQGFHKAEAYLHCGNIFEDRNLELLARLNCALHAEVLLKRDKDYIVRDGKVEIVDEFTGRIADKRHWPDNLHAAVEAKEGLIASAKGIILGSIALQHFISLYNKISGMTGTARAAAAELREFYNLNVVVIPTNKPCIRKDHEDLIFLTKSEKHKAILADVTRVHAKGQPVLIGTCSVEESEQLKAVLREAGISCTVLNAKNDAEEARIIAKAGELGAVTVSTNMAGRGVDIKLGGVDERQHDLVASLGGLYVIGTNRHESRRVDEQLRGRAGRQGDPGESILYISLEDEWIKKYDILKAFNIDYSNMKQDELQNSQVVRETVKRGQRLVEGYYSDLRVQQWKYSFIPEQQRRIIHKWRESLLSGVTMPELLQQKAPQRYEHIEQQCGKELLTRIEKQLTFYYINKHWADYLDYVSYLRDSIHLVVIGGQNPLAEYNRRIVQAFEEVINNIEQDIVEAFETVQITEKGIDMESEGLKAPTSTWTYLMNENPDQFSNLPLLIKAVSNAVKGPLFTIRSLYKRLTNKKNQKIIE